MAMAENWLEMVVKRPFLSVTNFGYQSLHTPHGTFGAGPSGRGLRGGAFGAGPTGRGHLTSQYIFTNLGMGNLDYLRFGLPLAWPKRRGIKNGAI